MEQSTAKPAGRDTGELLEGIVQDARNLIEQQFQLLRRELGDELHRIEGAAVAMGAGAGLAGLGVVLAGHMLVHGLHRSTGIPLWGCYGLVSGLLGAAGWGLLQRGRALAHDAGRSVLPRTVETLQENVTWLKQQVTAE